MDVTPQRKSISEGVSANNAQPLEQSWIVVADSHLQSESRPATVSPLSVPQTPKTGFVDAADRQNSIQWAEKTLSEKRNLLRKRFTDEESLSEEAKQAKDAQPVKPPLSPVMDESSTSIMSTSMMVEEHFAAEEGEKEQKEQQEEDSSALRLDASYSSAKEKEDDDDEATEGEEREKEQQKEEEEEEEEFANIEFDEDELISHYYSTESSSSLLTSIPVVISEKTDCCCGEELLFDTACLIDSPHPEHNFNHWLLMWMRKTYHAKREVLFPIFSHLFAMILGYYCRDVLTSLSVSKTAIVSSTSSTTVATSATGQQSEKV